MDGGCFVFGNHTPFFHPAGNLNIVKAFDLYKGKLIIFVGICVCHGCLYAGSVFLVGKQNILLKKALCHRKHCRVFLIFCLGNLGQLINNLAVSQYALYSPLFPCMCLKDSSAFLPADSIFCKNLLQNLLRDDKQRRRRQNPSALPFFVAILFQKIKKCGTLFLLCRFS